jgi:acylphosphatase
MMMRLAPRDVKWPRRDTAQPVGYNHGMRVARRFLVSGHVQGVGFRYFAQDAAQREGLTGYVANEADGTVTVVAEGAADSMDRFELALRRGPSRSRVEHVTVDEVAPTMRHAGFDIR